MLLEQALNAEREIEAMKTKTTFAHVAGLGLLLSGTLALGSGCEAQGPAEKAGENIDRGIERAQDAINPPGPAEKAGREVDRALNE